MPTYSTAHQNARLQQLINDAGATCEMRFYDGTPPASARDALSGNNLLATAPMANPIGGAPAGGVLTLTTPFSDPSPTGTGDTTFARMGPPGTDLAQYSVGTSGAEIIVDQTTITAGFAVTINSGTITEGN